MNIKNFYLFFDQKLFEFSDLFQQILLRQNGKSVLFPIKIGDVFIENKIEKRYIDPHHDGHINKILKKSSINRLEKKKYLELLDVYFSDLQHGFLHGFFCAFIDFYINNFDIQKLFNNFEYQKRLLTLLLHDFAKPLDDHGQFCKYLFSELDDFVIDHSNPVNDDNYLVLADRIELMRFCDYEDWIDFKKIKINKEKIHNLTYFYKKIRKEYEKGIFFYNKPLIFHSVEDVNCINNKEVIEFFPVPYEKQNNIIVNEPEGIQNWYKENKFSMYDGFLEDYFNCYWGYLDKKICAATPLFDDKINPMCPKERDHICIDCKFNIENWLFFNFKNYNENFCLLEEIFLEKNINFINSNTLIKIAYLQRQFYSRLLLFR